MEYWINAFEIERVDSEHTNIKLNLHFDDFTDAIRFGPELIEFVEEYVEAATTPADFHEVMARVEERKRNALAQGN